MPSLAEALAAHSAGRLAEAERHCMALLAAGEDAEALNLLAVLRRQQRRPGEAEALFRRALALRPEAPELHNNLGNALRDLGRPEAAEAAFRRAVALRPCYPEALRNLATLLAGAGRPEATAAYRALVQAAPEDADALNNLAVLLRREGRTGEALPLYRRALALQPAHPDACYNLGRALLDEGEAAAALPLLRQAAALRPEDAERHHALGAAQAALGDPAAAVEAYREAVRRDPEAIASLNNLGNALQAAGRPEEALAIQDRALALDPMQPDVRYNRALVLLLLGRAEGWAEHENRWDAPGFTSPRRGLAAPRWDGRRRPEATLLVHWEQGFGDTLQFVRYLAAARARVGRLVLEVQAPLRRLLEGIPGADAVVAAGEALPPHDLHLPLLSLPALLGPGAALAPPYLAASPRRPPGGRPRIGLVWAGNPLHGNDRNRSLPLAALGVLRGLPGLAWVSLQHGPRAAEVTGAEAPIAPGADFADTAAVVAGLDLVVAVDTAVAHLAGALGVPARLLLPFAPDWRWGPAGDTTPWYPAMRLLRQRAPGDWSAPLAELRAELERIAAAPGFGTTTSRF
jgi:Flp pilus assembly protein TadD